MKTRFLCGDVDWQTHGGKFITKKLNNGDWDYWLVLDFMNLDKLDLAMGNDKYRVDILAVSLQAAGQNKIDTALEFWGAENLDAIRPEYRNDVAIEALLDYGVYAPLQTFAGNNCQKVLKEARAQLECISKLFGFYMDKPKNIVGNTGWDFIKGDLGLGD